MLNFWNKAGNFITDAISGDKTKDEEYQQLCGKMSTVETGINSLTNILKNFKLYSEPFCKFLKLINDSITKIYKYSPMRIEINEIINTHLSIINDINNLYKVISKLNSKTSEWDAIFVKAKESIKIREEKRKLFDHYEQKLLKIEEDNNKKKIKDFIMRNKEKYNKASKEYIESSEKSFELIKHSIKLSWELVNPIFGELMILENDIFKRISSNLIIFENINHIFKIIMDNEYNVEKDINSNSNNNTNNSYDPKKYIKSKLLKNKAKNYEHTFIRNTNTFGKVPVEREQKFNNIKDKLLVDDEE